MPNKYFLVDGVATHVHHEGQTTLPEAVPDLRRGETILCLHGAGGNGAVFRPLMSRLAAQHSPLAFDQPGHARSGELDSLGSISRMAEFTRAFIERLGLSRPLLLGHSMGGAVAIAYALAHPRDVRGLVLCASGARFGIPEAILETTRRVTEGKERQSFNRDAYAAGTPPEIVRQGIMERMKTDPRARYGDLLACRDWNAEARICGLEVPVLVLVGDEEKDGLRAQADLIAERAPAARKVVIPKAAHMLMLEQPDAVAEAVSSFIGGLDR